MTHKEIEVLVDELGLYDAIEKVRNQLVTPYPEIPKKPFMKANPNSSEVEVFFHELRAWEKAKEVYDQQLDDYETSKQQFNSIIESFIKYYAGLHTIPEKSQQKVWEKAWQACHSGGYEQVYDELVELIDSFQ